MCVVVRGGKPQGERQAAHPSVADISHQSHHTARLNPDASTTTTTRKTSLCTVNCATGTVTSGGPSPTPLAASDLVNSIQNAIMLQRLLVCTAAIARASETLEALWRRRQRLKTLHKETQRRKQCHNYRGNDENDIQTHIRSRRTSSSAAVNFCSSSSLPITLAAWAICRSSSSRRRKRRIRLPS